jgi:hypothetical protein
MGMKGGGDEKIAPPNPNKMYPLIRCEVAIFDQKVNNLLREVGILQHFAKV